MLIKTKLDKNAYIKANLILCYKKPRTIIYTSLGVLLILYGIYWGVTYGGDIPPSLFITPVVLILIPPFFALLTAIISFNSSKRITETIEYQFEKDFLVIKGDSFTSQYSWDKIYKATQTKEFLLIWQTRTTANFIAKKDIWPGDIIELKEILDEHKVKNKL